MNASMTIEDFHALLTSERDDSPLLTALRELMGIEKTDEIVDATLNVEPLGSWV